MTLKFVFQSLLRFGYDSPKVPTLLLIGSRFVATIRSFFLYPRLRNCTWVLYNKDLIFQSFLLKSGPIMSVTASIEAKDTNS